MYMYLLGNPYFRIQLIKKTSMKKIFTAVAAIALMASVSAFTVKPADNYTVNTERSRVEWIGAKAKDYHTGTFNLKSGSLTADGGKLTGGSFVIDLTSIKVTDAGGGERLAGHLKSADFFDVAKNTEATFTISGVNYTSATNVEISGNLSIKGLNVPLKFPAVVRSADDKGFFGQAFFSIDRTLLGINYKGPANDVQLTVYLFAAKG